MNDYQTYYQRQLNLKGFGEVGQGKLRNAKVLVVGAGGLGCPVLQYLAGAGVGTIGIVDEDVVELHNLHRQTLYTVESVGHKKVEEAKRRIKLINPIISVRSFAIYLTIENTLDIIKEYDLVVDCSDNFAVRYLINDACVLLDKPFVYGSIYRFEGQVSVFNFNNGPTYRCVFPETETNKNVLNCNEDGVLGVLPGIIGLYQAMEVIKIITGIGESLSGKLMWVNLLTNQTQKIEVQRKNVDYKGELMRKEINKTSISCKSESISEISVSELKNLHDFIFLDVRNTYESPRLNVKNVVEIPLFEIAKRWTEIPKDKEIVCVCKSGMRSLQAAEILEKTNHFHHLYNLHNGITNEFINQWKKK